MTGTDPVSDLRSFLRPVPRGRPPEHLLEDLIRLLKRAWDHLVGSHEGGMHKTKLSRIEDVTWEPPRLRFTIERHGPTVMGSSRAPLQDWTVDLESRRASYEEGRYRQLRPRAKPLRVGPLADKLASAILKNEPHPYVRRTPGRAQVRAGSLLRELDPYVPNDTLAGRRRRLLEALAERLKPHGWQHVGRGVFVQRARAPDGR